MLASPKARDTHVDLRLNGCNERANSLSQRFSFFLVEKFHSSRWV
jgi:hypothetical protein